MVFLVQPTRAQSDADTLDSLEISLLTCSPHEAIYSLYGHTAIRCRNTITGEDIVVNYGVFDFAQPHFVTRFVFGLTDYSMGAYSFANFEMEYKYYGSSVTQQVLNISNEEKSRIMEALARNSLNPIYRYNFFYDNCTTRARDMLTMHLDGTVNYHSRGDSTATFRSMTHKYNEHHPWARFGNDMLLGWEADLSTTVSERQFLPSQLMDDFATATITDSSGTTRPLVSRTETIIPGGIQVTESEFPLSPLTCFIILAVIILAVCATEWWLHRVFWGFDLLLMVVAGFAGVVLTLMLFSHHPAVRLNLQLLLLNPLPLILAIPVALRARRGKSHWWWKAWAVLAVVFLFGRFFQHYAEGMTVLALSLLVRCIWHSLHQSRHPGTPLRDKK